MFALVLLPGCLAPWGTAIRATGDSPVAFGDIDVALWWEETDEERSDHGDATLLLSSGSFNCGDLDDEDVTDELIWKEAGVVVALHWANDPFNPGPEGNREGENVGFEGTYYQGASVGKSEEDGITTRGFESLLFAEGMAIYGVESGAPGTAEVTRHDPDDVAGHIKTDAYEARFTVENCGEIEEGSYDTAF